MNDRLGAQRVQRWLGDAELRLEGDELEVRTERPFAARMIDEKLTRDLEGIASEALGHPARVRIALRPRRTGDDPSARVSPPDRQTDRPTDVASPDGRHGRPARTETSSNVAPAPAPAPRIAPTAPRRPAATACGGLRELDAFVVGASNRLGYTAASQMANPTEGPASGLLFLHGECGVGKTHLLQGVCRRFQGSANRNGLPARVRYVTGEQFTNEYIAAVRDHTIDAFRERVRRLDLLAIDDIHFLANKVRTQNEFLHTLDAIGLTGARIVLASDGHPALIRRFSRSLVSRFLSGMVIEVQRPDRETRRAIARRLSESRQLRLTDGAIEAIASRCVGSVREIEGAVTKLAALGSLLAVDGDGPGSDAIGVGVVEQVLDDATTRPARPVQIGGIIEAAATRLDVTRPELAGGSRRSSASLARSVVGMLAREMTPSSYPEIARALGLASHASVHRSVKQIRDRIESGDTVRDTDGGTIEIRELVDQIRHDARAEAFRAAR